MRFHFYIPEGICFAAFVAFVADPTDKKERQESKHAHKNQETNENTTKNTNKKLHSITTCNKGNKSSEAEISHSLKYGVSSVLCFPVITWNHEC
jgi:hypothetical protein